MIENLLLCIGAQKSGTSWLHAQLVQHPGIHFPGLKEVHYFNTIHSGSVLLSRRKVRHLEKLIREKRPQLEQYFTDLSRGKPVDPGIHRLMSPVDDHWYCELYRGAGQAWAADFTPEYALLPTEGFDNIKRVARQHKLMFLMRDPVGRALSALQYSFRPEDRNEPQPSNETLWETARAGHIVGMSRYEVTLQQLRENFAPENVLCLFFEQMMTDKVGSLDRVQDFLGIDRQTPVTQSIEEKVNASAPIRIPAEIEHYFEQQLAPTYRAVREAFGGLPQQWRNPST